MATMYNFATPIYKPFGKSKRMVGWDIKGKWVSNKTENRKKAMKYAITHAKPFKLTPFIASLRNDVWLISNQTYVPNHMYGGDGVPTFEKVGVIDQNSVTGEWEYTSYMEPTANIHYYIDFDGSITRKTAIPRKSETQPWKYGKKW